MNNMWIITVVMDHLNKRIKRKINNIHSNYSSMFDAIKRFDRDKELAIPLMEKWIPRLKTLKHMVIGSTHDANKPLKIAPTHRIVKGIVEYQGLVDPMEKRIKELL